VRPQGLLGDKAYDSNAFRASLAAIECVAVIPSNRSRAQAIPYDKDLYKARGTIEIAQTQPVKRSA
jgi:hypothetical protein